jgi:hypothetical protein
VREDLRRRLIEKMSSQLVEKAESEMKQEMREF